MKGLQVFAKMAEENNQTLKLAPLGNIESSSKSKDGWGKVTIAVDNETIEKLLKNELCGGFVVCDKSEYDKLADPE